MYTKRLAILFVSFLVSVGHCYGFGSDGHRIVGAIAETYLTPTAKTQAQELLGSQSLADVATWADDVRNNPQYFFAKPLHFINVPRDATEIDEAWDCSNGTCVTAAIRKYRDILKDHSRSPAERAEALRFVVHFVGDVHQPLHVSFKDDQGGNLVKVKWLGDDWSLHSVWDSGIIKKRRGTHTWQQLTSDIRAGISASEEGGWSQNLDPMAWANESLRITHEIYNELPATLSYFQKNSPRFDDQLAKAGLRLGKLLNEIFATPLNLTSTSGSDSQTISVCTFNIQFLGNSPVRDNVRVACYVRPLVRSRNADWGTTVDLSSRAAACSNCNYSAVHLKWD